MDARSTMSDAPSGSTWAIVVAAGSGERFGGAKQLAPLHGRRVLDWALAAAEAACDGVVLVVSARHRAEIEATLGCARGGSIVVTGDASRSGSVRRGLAAVPPSAEVIAVHDAARPLATPDLFRRVIAEVVAGADGAIPGVPVVDTIRRVAGGRDGIVDRAHLVAVQTPQAFRADALRSAHRGEPEASDDASLVEAAGGNVVVVPGEVANRKITDPIDLVIADALLRDAGR
jgi:2-C-methyl-D-erythritol 4-phosphate cytidylyltransferase